MKLQEIEELKKGDVVLFRDSEDVMHEKFSGPQGLIFLCLKRDGDEGLFALWDTRESAIRLETMDLEKFIDSKYVKVFVESKGGRTWAITFCRGNYSGGRVLLRTIEMYGEGFEIRSAYEALRSIQEEKEVRLFRDELGVYGPPLVFAPDGILHENFRSDHDYIRFGDFQEAEDQD